MTGDRQALMHIAAKIKRDLDFTATVPARDAGQPTRAIYVVAEPAIFFQLKAVGEPVVGPVQDVPIAPATVGGQPVPTLLVTGLHASRDLAFQEQWSVAKDRWELVKTFDYKPSAIVWLDLNDPRKPQDKEALADNHIRLFRLKQ